MNAQDLKNSILQRAIEGKLVPQRKEEGTAKELLAEIRVEKARLIKEKKIKKSKPLPEITDEEKPFDIPESWEWVRLLEISSTIGDGIHGTPQYSQDGEYYFINGNNLQDNRIIIKKDTKKVSITEANKYLVNLNKQTLLVSINGTLGNTAFYNSEDVILGKSACYINLLSKINKRYICYLVKSDYFMKYALMIATGTTIKNVSLRAIRNLLIPLPPLSEQSRIVGKIEEIQPDIDAYDKAQTKLQAIEQRFPDDMKKSLLQYAIEGKLVPQRKEEGTAKDLLANIRAEKARLVKEKKIKKSKPLPAITDDEKPFDIPDSWEWVRLGDIGALVRGSGIKRSETTNQGKPCVRYGELYTTYRTRFSSAVSHTTEEVFNKSKKVHKNDILMSLTGENKWDIALAVVYEGEEEIAMGGDMTKWEYHGMNSIYLTIVLNSPYGISCKRNMATGDIIVHISNSKLSEIVLPIPPLAEQHRIVAKLEELLPLCQQLDSHP